MWSNSRRRKANGRSANVRDYLGMADGANESRRKEPPSSSSSSSSSSSLPSSLFTAPQAMGTVLVEIPEELESEGFFPASGGKLGVPGNGSRRRRGPRVSGSSSNNSLGNNSLGNNSLGNNSLGNNSSSNSLGSNSHSGHRRSAGRDDSSAVEELGNHLGDLDNYLLSVFHMDDEYDAASIYTKGTADTSLSSSSGSSVASTASTRRRHKGAFRNRRKGAGSGRGGGKTAGTSSWLESMQNSSRNVFVAGGETWTPGRGWGGTRSKTNLGTAWDADPGDCWKEADSFFAESTNEH